MFEIKKATAVDIPLIRELCFQVWPQTYQSIITQQQIDFMLEMMYSPAALKFQMEEEKCIFILIYDNKLPIGFAAYSEAEKEIWKLHRLYILQNQQGKGVGKYAVQYIIDEIKILNGKALQLQVNRKNEAKVFYEKLGFTVIKIADFDIGNGFLMTDYVMEKKLN